MQKAELSPDSETVRSGAHPRLVTLEANYRQFLTAVGWGVASSICLIAAISFSFATSATPPYTPFRNPSRSVLVVNILSNLSVLLLAGFMMELNEKLRWFLASRSSGVNFVSFLGLSRATSDLGVLRMLFTKAMELMDRLWCLQREGIQY